MISSDGITILKIGGSVITDKSADEGVAMHDEISRIAKEIAGFEGKLIIVHGAGSFGHPQAKRYSLTDKFDAEGSIITHLSVKELNRIVVDHLNDAGINAVSVHPMGNTVCKSGRISSMFLDNILIMLDHGFVPVLHGDVVMDSGSVTSILSGDQIVPYLASVLDAKRIGIGSAKDGVLDDKGMTISSITGTNFEQIEKYIGGSENTDVTGGMYGKVLELLDLCEKSNISSYIFNAIDSGNVSKFLSGEDIGTAIKDED